MLIAPTASPCCARTARRSDLARCGRAARLWRCARSAFCGPPCPPLARASLLRTALSPPAPGHVRRGLLGAARLLREACLEVASATACLAAPRRLARRGGGKVGGGALGRRDAGAAARGHVRDRAHRDVFTRERRGREERAARVRLRVRCRGGERGRARKASIRARSAARRRRAAAMGAKRALAHSNSRGKGTGLGGRGAEAHLLSFAMLLFTLANHALKLASMAASTSGRCSARSWSSATSTLRS